MIFYIAVALLLGWLLGMLVFEVGKFVHVPLLVGLLLLLVAFLQARDTARNSSE